MIERKRGQKSGETRKDAQAVKQYLIDYGETRAEDVRRYLREDFGLSGKESSRAFRLALYCLETNNTPIYSGGKGRSAYIGVLDGGNL